MHNLSELTVKTIRLEEDVCHRARVAAVTSRKSLREWLEEAILEKPKRDPRAAS